MKGILELCGKNKWAEADASLKLAIKESPDQPQPYAMAAHTLLRQGKIKEARWLINKAQSLEPHDSLARIEDICLDFYEAKYEEAYRKIFSALLESAPKEHPVHLVSSYLCCFYSDRKLYESIKNYFAQPLSWKGFGNVPALLAGYFENDSALPASAVDDELAVVDYVQGLVKCKDKFMACIAARYAEIFFPSEANSFAALGIFNLHAGFFENASRNFHEAIFRETSYPGLVKQQQFYLFCRQKNFERAIKIALQLENAGLLDAKGQALLLEAMLRSKYNLKEVQNRLGQLLSHLNNKGRLIADVDAVNLRVKLAGNEMSRKQVMDLLAQHVRQAGCAAAYLYLYAQLLADENIMEARKYAARALELDQLHPDAQRWDDSEELHSLNFEYAGLFIPREHEGGALPTPTQLKLLDILFLLPQEKIAEKWEDFTKEHVLYTLEAGAARLLPFIYKRLSGSLPDDEIAAVDLLKGIWKKSYFENALRLRDMKSLLAELENSGVEVVLLKGMANSIALYDDLGSRPMSDIDVLVDQKYLEKADKILRSNGWSCSENITPSRLRFSYAMSYRHKNGGCIDMHWRPCEHLNADFYDAEDIGKPDMVDFMGHKWKTLSPTINLLCTILHGVGWNHLSPVRWVSDACLILKKYPQEIDWEHIYKLAKKYHGMPTLAVGLNFLSRFDLEFKKQLPKKFLKELGNNYEDDILIKIQMRPYSQLGSFEEALARLEYFKKRFAFRENDYLFICGGDKPEYVKAECEKRGIYWATHCNHEMLFAVQKAAAPYNFITIDANLSCVFQCFSKSN